MSDRATLLDDIVELERMRDDAIDLIRSVRDGNGWKEIPLGVLNQLEAILLGKEGGDAVG